MFLLLQLGKDMNKFKRKYATSLILMSSWIGILSADQSLENCNAEISACSTVESRCCSQPSCIDEFEGGFFIRGDLLYWKSHLSGLELDFGTGAITQVTTDGVVITNSTELDEDPHFKWNVDYRIAAGYQSSCSPFVIEGVWTHFQDSSHRTNGLNHARTTLRFDQIDAVFAYRTSVNSCLTLNPFVGVRGAIIHEKIKSLLITDITFSPTSIATETRTFDDHQNYRGIGPVIGIQGDFDIGCGFGVYGEAAVSVLYGNYKVHYNDSDVLTAPVSREFFSVNRKKLHAFDSNIDLVLGIRWVTCIGDSFPVAMKLGFEHHQYFNQCRLGSDRGDLSLDGGVFSVETLF